MKNTIRKNGYYYIRSDLKQLEYQVAEWSDNGWFFAGTDYFDTKEPIEVIPIPTVQELRILKASEKLA